MKRRRLIGRLIGRRVARIVGWLICGVLLWFLLAWGLPFPDEKLQQHPQNTRFVDRQGGLLRRTLSAEGLDADWLSLDETGDWAGAALIAVEDKRFYRHFGVDPIAVLRAVGQNLSHFKVVSGASTLSTQVIRMTEPRPRHLGTKLIEAFRATQLEMRYDKAFILEQYLNRAPFGGNRQGIATAARCYYGKEAAALSSGEAALLMGLPQSPSRFRPDRAPEKAEKRRETVLRRMREEGLLTADPLLVNGPLWHEPVLEAFHFTEWMRRRQGGQTGEVQTTLDQGEQRTCEEVLRRMRLMPGYQETDGVGVVVMDARSGEIRAWVGSWDPTNPEHGQVDTVTRRRAPGSTLKPFAYALAMEQGWLTPETLLQDEPRVYRDYHPQNMDEQWRGEVTARVALVESLNMPALQVTEKIGLPLFLGTLRAVGMSLPGLREEKVGLGVVLGGGMDVSLLELVQAYGVFAREGMYVSGRGRPGGTAGGGRIFHPGVAYWISAMLGGAERDGLLYGHGGDVRRPHLAFKTGTSHGLRDAWSIGWNEERVIGVWVGRMDGGAVEGLSGGGHAAPILGELAEALLGPGSGEWPRAPERVVQWQGREMLRGITNPMAAQETAMRQQILSPAPQSHLQRLDGGPVQVKLQVTGRSGEQVHWFVNGGWIGARPVEDEWAYTFSSGRYALRAVFADGQSDTRELRIN